MKLEMRFAVTLVGFLFHFQTDCQNCIDYGVFEEPMCIACTPPGWNGVLGAEEFDDVTTYGSCFSLDWESPSGGTAVALDITGSGFSEGINTTITGLIPDIEYNLAFWWASITYDCGSGPLICCADLSIEVDGEVTIFPAADDWTLVELCVTPSTTEFYIELLGVWTTMQGFIVIDDAACEDATLSCCGLYVELEEELYVCPNEEIILDAEVIVSTGDPVFSWESDPPEGLTYLLDTDIEDPEFLYEISGSDFPGIEFNYTLTTEDENCIVLREITVFVNPYPILNFDFEDDVFCEDDGLIVLNPTSIEGITGSWTPGSVEAEDYAGQFVDLTFIPDASEVDCPLESGYRLKVEEYIEPTFDFPLTFCRADFDLFFFPTESLEGIEGEWNIEELILEDWTDGDLDIHFTPDDLFCTAVTELIIDIESGIVPVFLLQDQYCLENRTIELETEDENGLDGNWNNTHIDLSTPGVYQAIFTVDDDDDCFYHYEYNYEVLDSIIVTFDTLSPICKNSQLIELDSFSREGFLGVGLQTKVDNK